MTALKKSIQILILAIFSLSLVVSPIYAQENVLNEQVESEEEQRKNELRTTLGLDLPLETDNPNYQVEFTEPDGGEVEIKVDDEDYAAKKSPYTLPSLSIGRHTISFKFEDSDGVEQVLEEVLIIIPREPVFSQTEDLSFDDGSEVSFSGTALPNSTLVFIISSDLVMQLTTADANGAWTLSVTEEIDQGNHEIVGFVRKDGYASDFSDPVSFYVGIAQDTTLEVGESENVFPFNLDINFSEIFSDENKYYFIGAGGVLLIILLSVIGGSMRVRNNSKKEAENVKDDGDDDGLTLRDKLSGKGKVKQSKKKEESEKSNKLEEDENTEKEEKSDEDQKPDSSQDKPSEKIDNVDKPKKPGLFKRLFGSSSLKATTNQDEESVKKVVSKEEFIEDFKGDKKDEPKEEQKEESKEKPNEEEKPKESKKDEKSSKSNKIEVTLG